MYVYVYIYIYTYIHIYIYIYIYRPRRGGAERDVLSGSGAKDYTPDLTKMKVHGKMSLKVHWIIPVQIHWTSDNPLENTTEKSGVSAVALIDTGTSTIQAPESLQNIEDLYLKVDMKNNKRACRTYYVQR